MNTLQRLAKSIVHRRLSALASGCLVVRDRGAVRTFGDAAEPSTNVEVVDDRFYQSVLLGGHIGAAEAYAAGWWNADDLTDVIRLFVRNRSVLDGLEGGLARLAQPIRTGAHALRRNTRRGSRRNIAAHYDLGNDFFGQFLDETLTYSCAYFEHQDSTLAEASRAKYDRICQKLRLGREHHVLEIGGGWGGFAIHAASRYGCRVTTVTVSEEQYRMSRERLAAQGLLGLVDVQLKDYRDVTGHFDRLVSIEMIEAVGHHYFGTFFDRCAKVLQPDGLAAIQAITIQDRHYQRARREVDFIKRYIFPGSCIPSISALATAWTPTDLRLIHAEDIGPHYARTLREWRERFDVHASSLTRLGYDEWFQRLWRFYFSYCEGGFAEGALGVSQILLAKPAAALTLGRSPSLARQAA